MKKNLAFTALVFLSFFLSNCKKNTYESEKPPNDYTMLMALGYDTTGIKDMGQYYTVEGDIVIPKSALTTVPRQAMGNSGQQVSPSKQRNITVRIDNSVYVNGSNFDWSAEVPQAIAEFNSLETSNIRLTLTTSSTADITIKAQSILGSPNTIAEAPLPSGGNPGSFVRINTTYAHTPTSSGQKKYNLVHELGHCIGFNHTNWYNTGEGPFSAIGNSPNSSTQTDFWSVMNGGTAAFSWSGFSDWDIYAVSFLYPSTTLTINGLSATCSSGSYNLSGPLPANFSLTWNASAPPLNTIVAGHTLQIVDAQNINRKVNLTATIDYLGNPLMTVQKSVQAGALSPWDYNIKFLRPGTGVHCGNGNYIVDGVPPADYTALEIVSNSSTLSISQMSGSPMFYAYGVSSNPYSNAVKVRFQNSCGWGHWGIYYLQAC